MINNSLVIKIENILPQTQCTRCGYPTCHDYATAIANQEADINQCPPGGNEGIKKLANLLNTEFKPLNPKNGSIKPKTVVVIDENVCIGCTLCIKACPVDAILGSNKMLHTVIAQECTGCELCVPVCPVDCIYIEPDNEITEWNNDNRELALLRFNNHKVRKQRDILEREERLKQRALLLKKNKSIIQLLIF